MHTPTRGRKKQQADISHLSATVASGLFWPGLGTQSEEAEVKLHPKVCAIKQADFAHVEASSSARPSTIISMCVQMPDNSICHTTYAIGTFPWMSFLQPNLELGCCPSQLKFLSRANALWMAVGLLAQMQEKLEMYASKYYLLKSPRKLQWQPHLGTVHFTLTVGQVTRDFTVPPVLVTILMHFQVRILYCPKSSAFCPATVCLF